MIPLLYLSNVLCASGQSALGKLSGRLRGSNAHFNLAKAAAALLLFALWASLRFTFHLPTLLYGALYGIFSTASAVAGLAALTTGPMALASVIVSFSLVLPCLFGILFLGETLSLFGGIGLFLLAASILLLKRRSSGQLTGRWWVLVFVTLVSNGICSILQKLHQRAFPKLFQVEFMLWATAVVFLYLAGMTLFNAVRPQNSKAVQGGAPLRIPLLLGVGSGILNGGANYLSLSLAALENAVILYPVQSALTALASFLVGRFLFREKVTRLQLLGLSLGVAAVVLLKI